MWIAARVRMGTAKGAKTVLHQLAHGHHRRKATSTAERCAQLEFQPTVDPFLERSGNIYYETNYQEGIWGLHAGGSLRGSGYRGL